MITTRIPPSPTGNFHLGTARTSLYNRLLAKQNNGKFILRIEDTDTARSTKFFEQDIMDGLQRLGLDRDIGPDREQSKEIGPFHQMDRLDIYKKYVDILLNSGKAYYARETSEELDELRKQANEQKKPFVYRQIEYTSAQIQKFQSEGRTPVVRFKVNPKTVVRDDAVKGEISFDMSQVGDFVIMKSDGIPTYYIANVVDDHLMGVTHIIRGEDHVPNTPKQILLYEAYDWEIPVFGHLPLILTPGRTKMSKRNETDEFIVTVSKFREQGFLPDAVINFIALLGRHTSDDREIFTLSELISEFSIDRIQSSNAAYDFKRALWFNSEHIRLLSDQEFTDKLQDYLNEYGDQEWQEILKITEQEYWLKFAPYIKVRLQTLAQFKDYAKYFFKMQFPSSDILYSTKMKVSDAMLADILPYIIEMLESIDEKDFTEENLQQKIIAFIQARGLKNGQVLRPIRAILTGVAASPGAFEMLYVLGKQESLNRLKAFAEQQLQK